MKQGLNAPDTTLEPTDFVGFVTLNLGEDTALSIQEVFGGQRLYIPRSPAEHHILCKVIGLAQTQHIALEFGDGVVQVPLGPASRRARIERACLAGLTTTEVARSLGCCTRTVSKARARLRRDGLLR